MTPLAKTGLLALREHVGDITVEIPGQAGFLYRIPVTKKAAQAVIKEADGNLVVCRDFDTGGLIVRAPKR